MLGLGVQELLLILVLVLIFFGAEKIPQLARSLGKGMSEFRKAQQDMQNDLLQESRNNPKNPSLANAAGGDSVIERMTCSACGDQFAKESRFCPQCGQAVTLSPQCAVCQQPMSLDHRFCPNCGQART